MTILDFVTKKYFHPIENIRGLSRYVSGKAKKLDFNIPDIEISSMDTVNVQNKILPIDHAKRKKLKINKSTL